MKFCLNKLTAKNLMSGFLQKKTFVNTLIFDQTRLQGLKFLEFSFWDILFPQPPSCLENWLSNLSKLFQKFVLISTYRSWLFFQFKNLPTLKFSQNEKYLNKIWRRLLSHPPRVPSETWLKTQREKFIVHFSSSKLLNEKSFYYFPPKPLNETLFNCILN